MARYRTLTDGEWQRVHGPLMRLSCCDCQLVHLVEVRPTREGFRFRAWRDRKATTARRKAKQ